MQNPFHQAFAQNPTQNNPAPQNATVKLNPTATEQLKKIRNRENNPNLMLRITIAGGGCSGFQYKFSLDDNITEHDKIFGTVICDNISLQYLDGATIEYKETLSGSAFHISNPNAESSCGCGVSFSPTK